MTAPTLTSESAMTDRRMPLDVLAETPPRDGAPDLRGLGMPPELERRYGGVLTIPLRGDRPTVIANFVSTIDGIVALGEGDLAGGGLISGFHEPDRFVMGLLRALADMVVVGAGTLRGSDEHRWIAEHVHPGSAAAFAAWRATMGLPKRPTTVIVTGSGDIPVDHHGLSDPTVPVIIVTTPAGAERVRAAGVAEHVSIESIETDGPITGRHLAELAARRGARLILTEGGPHLLGQVVAADVLDELFLTLAPQIVGRGSPERLGLVEGVALPPTDARWFELASLRRSADHLFMRYRAKEA
jgi:riboflavin biosynthesis pyrimidine reductase